MKIETRSGPISNAADKAPLVGAGDAQAGPYLGALVVRLRAARLSQPAHPRAKVLPCADMAARLFVSRDTLWRLERGDPTVALGTLATAAFVLQLHDRLANLAAPATDALALDLDERRVPKRIRRTQT